MFWTARLYFSGVVKRGRGVSSLVTYFSVILPDLSVMFLRPEQAAFFFYRVSDYSPPWVAALSPAFFYAYL